MSDTLGGDADLKKKKKLSKLVTCELISGEVHQQMLQLVNINCANDIIHAFTNSSGFRPEDENMKKVYDKIGKI